MKPERFSCRIYGLLIREGKVLLTRSRFHGRTFVNYPGGGVEMGEAPGEALAREFVEETGLKPRLKRILFSSQEAHYSTQIPIQIVSVYCLVDADGEPTMAGNGDDVVELFWAPIDAVPTDEMFPAELEFTGRLASLL